MSQLSEKTLDLRALYLVLANIEHDESRHSRTIRRDEAQHEGSRVSRTREVLEVVEDENEATVVRHWYQRVKALIGARATQSPVGHVIAEAGAAPLRDEIAALDKAARAVQAGEAPWPGTENSATPTTRPFRVGRFRVGVAFQFLSGGDVQEWVKADIQARYDSLIAAVGRGELDVLRSAVYDLRNVSQLVREESLRARIDEAAGAGGQLAAFLAATANAREDDKKRSEKLAARGVEISRRVQLLEIDPDDLGSPETRATDALRSFIETWGCGAARGRLLEIADGTESPAPKAGPEPGEVSNRVQRLDLDDAPQVAAQAPADPPSRRLLDLDDEIVVSALWSVGAIDAPDAA